jgi:broad specificity polyphosphatase/5'/3'-nucleotidase SurE
LEIAQAKRANSDLLPQVGNNIGLAVLLSGTVGATTYAAYNAGIPAVAFSGATGSQTAWNASATYPDYSQVYADLALNLTDHLVASGAPYLPNNVSPLSTVPVTPDD